MKTEGSSNSNEGAAVISMDGPRRLLLARANRPLLLVRGCQQLEPIQAVVPENKSPVRKDGQWELFLSKGVAARLSTVQRRISTNKSWKKRLSIRSFVLRE